MKGSWHRQDGRRIHVILAALLLVCAGVGYWMVDSAASVYRMEQERAAMRISQAAVEAVSQRIERSLEGIASLHSMARRARLDRLAQPEAAPTSIERHLVELTQAGRYGVLQVGIIDARGSLAWTTVPGFDPNVNSMDLSDREHFRVHREGRLAPFVSAPLVGRASGRWSIQITRPILDEGGAFQGVVVVSIDPLGLSADLQELDFAPGAFSTLLREDGVVLTRSIDPQAHLGRRISADHLAEFQARDSGVGRFVSSVSGGEMMIAWQSVRDWPLKLTFGLAYDPICKTAMQFRQILLFVLLLVLVTGGAAGLLVIIWSARREQAAEIARTKASAQEVIELIEALPGIAYRGKVAADGSYCRRNLSSAIARISGWPVAAFDDPGFYQSLRSPVDGAESRTDFLRRVYRDSQATQEYRLRTADDRFVWLREDCRVIRRSDQDAALEVVGLAIDITEERQLKAQAFAAAKLATLGEMATGIAHELNQPCASITLAADVAAFELNRGAAGDLASARDRLEDIARQTMRMRDVIDHFQVFGRSSEGEDGAIAIRDAVSGALKISTGMLNAAGIGLTVDVPDGLPPVHARLVPLEQVLVNLLLNARDAMKGAGEEARQIELVAQHDAPAGQVVLAIRDHGHGLAPEHLDRVFEPFFTTKPVGQGTGLGLAIAYGTVRGFGGTIEIMNHPQGGAVASIRLAAAEATQGTGPSAKPKAADQAVFEAEQP